MNDQVNAPTPHWLWCVVVVWAILVVAGLSFLLRYNSTPGGSGDPPREIPTTATISRDVTRPTLILFANPQCPCTLATIHELEKAIGSNVAQAHIHVVVWWPPSQGEDWLDSELIREAKRNQYHLVTTRDEALVEKFRIRTSGHVLLYSNDGHLIFSGGITQGRGHEGDNVGRRQLQQLLVRAPKPSATSRSFAEPSVLATAVEGEGNTGSMGNDRIPSQPGVTESKVFGCSFLSRRGNG